VRPCSGPHAPGVVVAVDDAQHPSDLIDDRKASQVGDAPDHVALAGHVRSRDEARLVTEARLLPWKQDGDLVVTEDGCERGEQRRARRR